MALDARLLDTSIIGRGARKGIDIAKGVNIYTSLQANKRANKLSELTLSKAERELKKRAEIKKIYMDPAHTNENGTRNAESMIGAFQKGGHPEAATKVQNQMFKVYEQRQKTDKEMSRMADAVLNSKTPFAAYDNLVKESTKNNLTFTKDALAYEATEEDLAKGELNPKIKTYLEFIRDKTLTREERRKLKEKSGAEEYGLSPIYGEREGEIVAMQTSKSGKIKELDLPEGVTLSPSTTKMDLGDKWGILDRAGNLIMTYSKGIDPGKKVDIGFKTKEEERKVEAFKEQKKKWAISHQKLKRKNKSAINKFSRFSRKSRQIANSPNLQYITGQGRYKLSGKGVPFFETKGKDLQADLDNLIAMGAINTMIQLKAESKTGSTGFGALSAPELAILQNALGSLENDKLSPKKKRGILLEVADIIDKYQDSIEDFENENPLGPEKTESNSQQRKKLLDKYGID